MVNKTYTVIQKEDIVSISVASPFIGNWEFQLNEMTYEEICSALNAYCSGELVQTCFSNLLPTIRENFITPPALWKNIYD
jgi:hypothetical protein